MNKAMHYGRVPVSILENTSGLGKGEIYLLYLHVFPDGYQAIVPLNTGEYYTHFKVKPAYMYNYMKTCRLLPVRYTDAIKWLKKYCVYHQINWKTFDIRYTWKKDSIHFSLKEGDYECPCTEVFTLCKSTRHAERCEEQYIRAHRRPERLEET